MANTKKACDVFISHSMSDAPLALEVANAMRASGLEAVTITEFRPGQDVSDASWEALAESRALLAILSPSGPTPSMSVELGAARAWNKPIYGVVTDPSFSRLPPSLAGIHLYPTGRIQDVINAIREGSQQLSDEDRTYLAKVYSDLGVSVDQLALDPKQLEHLVKKYHSGRGKKVVSEEHLLSELLRMRKQGKLTRNGTTRRSRSHRELA